MHLYVHTKYILGTQSNSPRPDDIACKNIKCPLLYENYVNGPEMTVVVQSIGIQTIEGTDKAKCLEMSISADYVSI